MKERTIDLAGQAFKLKFTLDDRDEIEERLGKGLWECLRDGRIRSAATILWGGIRHARKKLEVTDVLRLMEEHRAGGGEYDVALREAVRGMFEASLFGKNVTKERIDEIIGSEDEEGKEPAGAGVP